MHGATGAHECAPEEGHGVVGEVGKRVSRFRARHARTAVALALGATLTAGLGGALSTASAEQRTITVTLLGGKVISLTVDVPPGTPLDQISLPPALAPLVSVTAEKAPAGIP